MKQLISQYSPDEILLIGFTCDPNITVGAWCKLNIDQQIYRFFPVQYRNQEINRPFLPARMSFLIQFLRWRHLLLPAITDSVFVQAPEVMIGLLGVSVTNLCYCFPGVENPLSLIHI